MNYEISYAQNREDIYLSTFFPDLDNGFYVDVGANHPTVESVTKYFYRKGWVGINIEPTRRLYELLDADRPKDINLQIGVSNRKGTMNFREYPYGDGLSTFSVEMQKSYEKTANQHTKNFLEYPVEVATLKDIFTLQKASVINFLKIDIEGYEYEALEGNDWSKYRPQVICIEANHIFKDWRPLLKHNHYQLVTSDGLNEYYIARENQKLVDNFSYADRFIMGPKIIDWSVYCDIQDLARKHRRTLFKFNFTKQKHDNLESLYYHDKKKGGLEVGLKESLKLMVKALNRALLRRLESLKKDKRQPPEFSGVYKDLSLYIQSEISRASTLKPKAAYVIFNFMYSSAIKTAISLASRSRRG